MVATTLETVEVKQTNQVIPKYLIREEMNGKPYYYKGYKQVLSQEKTAEEIMGASGLQSFIIDLILGFLYENVSKKQYRFFTNEVGGHINKRNNLSFDIAIYDKSVLTFDKINEHYVKVPPKVVVEIDVKIETENETALDYVTTKTDKILAFGAEKVIWILTKNKKIIIATPNEDWRTMNWDKSFELIDGEVINLQKMIDKEDVATAE